MKLKYVSKKFDFSKTESISNIELDITLRCNAQCPDCDRLCSTFPILDSDMSLDQISLFIRQIKSWTSRNNRPLNKITIMGGEPLVHPNVIEICQKIYELVPIHIKEVHFRTNGILPIPKEINNVIVSTISSKKNQHQIFFKSPSDYKIPYKKCDIPIRCGISLNTFGYFPCAAGGSIIRLFGLYDMVLSDIPDNLNIWDYGKICRHCYWSNSKGQLSDWSKPSTCIQCSKTYKEKIDNYAKIKNNIKRWH